MLSEDLFLKLKLDARGPGHREVSDSAHSRSAVWAYILMWGPQPGRGAAPLGSVAQNLACLETRYANSLCVRKDGDLSGASHVWFTPAWANRH